MSTTATMDNTISAQVQDFQVKFVPPLHEQRRAWALQVLRNEQVSSVLDVGCGEGILLQHLSHAAPWLAHTPATPAPATSDKTDFIHVRELHGLDLVRSDLEFAIDATAPPKHGFGWTRFEPLNISIWHGALQVPNAAFEGIECIVATEVIEHLPADALAGFAPVLLGGYAPRLLLFTTPSYDFNARFRVPGDPAPWGFADPTGRTDRLFRHPDHKFEWTADECAAWSKAVADEWGYDVVVEGLGRSVTKDPWGRDAAKAFASQAVTLRRRDGAGWAAKRAARFAAWAAGNAAAARPHELLGTHHYAAHEGAEKPAARADIAAVVKMAINDIGTAEVTVFELWREEAVATFCGGWLEVLVDAIGQDPSFVLTKEGKNVDDWRVELLGVELRDRDVWKRDESQEEEDAWNEGSEVSEDETWDEEEYEEEYAEEYDYGYEEETEETAGTEPVAAKWGMPEGWGAESDAETLKTWADWKPTDGWMVEGGWD
ncbi:hypothetical protein BC834DRAFT_869774 [Gloeopeniophorella convolvens]|nr:hypothetical protein BC834DRAFT_869774 [Gloeopeniophorella convolvens]